MISRHVATGLLSVLFSTAALAQTGLNLPLTKSCHSSSSVLCINKYLSVLPYHFFRPSTGGKRGDPLIDLSQTELPSNYSSTTAAIGNATFLVYDQERGLEILGDNPTYDYVFAVSEAVHEAPVYWEEEHKLFLSQLAPPPGYLPQLVIDLNPEEPILSEFLSDPPVYAPNGGTFYGGLVYWGASGGNRSIGGMEQRPGIRTLDPKTNRTVTLLNNYFGFYFNTVDDVVVDERGDVWFTDPYYSWYNALSDTPPQLTEASYRFRPSTGAVNVVDDSIREPNGIALAPGGEIMYISGTGAISGTIDPRLTAIHGTSFNRTDQRAIYKFDIVDCGQALVNKRSIYTPADLAPDGLKVAQNGMVVTGTGRGVDVVDEYGTLILRIQTNYTVQNFDWVKDKTTGKLTEFWLMGQGGISRVRWSLEGQTRR